MKNESDRQELMGNSMTMRHDKSGFGEQYQRMENAHEMIDEILL